MNPADDNRADSDTTTTAESESKAEAGGGKSAAPDNGTTEGQSPFELTESGTTQRSLGDQEDTLTKGTREDRKSWVEGCRQTLVYIGRVSNDKTLHFRSSDKVTTRLLIGAFLMAVTFLALPFFGMNGIAFFCYVIADIMLLVAVSVFVLSRFGIIRAMQPRHALVCWHLMVGTGLLALVIGFNFIAVIVLYMMRERLQLLFPGG
ncbi:MAG: hypothetical protein K2X93_04325 [Candidatus Obscuribacterales bacterium]|nr:hypothetical protein [Candidatus Obscuribacterales bacterium]